MKEMSVPEPIQRGKQVSFANGIQPAAAKEILQLANGERVRIGQAAVHRRKPDETGKRSSWQPARSQPIAVLLQRPKPVGSCQSKPPPWFQRSEHFAKNACGIDDVLKDFNCRDRIKAAIRKFHPVCGHVMNAYNRRLIIRSKDFKALRLNIDGVHASETRSHRTRIGSVAAADIEQ